VFQAIVDKDGTFTKQG